MATDKNTKYAFIIPATGNTYRVSYNKKQELKVLQALVGGYIEALNTKNTYWLQPERDFARIAKKGKVYVNDDRQGLEENPHAQLEEIVLTRTGMITIEDLKAMPRRLRPIWGNIVITMTALQADRLTANEDINGAFPYEGTYFP